MPNRLASLADIQIRDPFVLPVAEEGAYYLFGSTDPDVWNGPGTGFDCYRSIDLVEWHGPIAAFRPPAAFWATTNFWAPEVHRVGDGWFMFATFTAADGHRATQVLRSAAPQGPYEPWSEGGVTPPGWPCLDGTLHIDEEGPWLVFCHEWVQCGDGEVCAVRLSDDLRSTTGDVELLFRASEAPWSVHVAGFEELATVSGPLHVTDGPFLHRAADGQLLLLWSSMGAHGYAMGLARSSSGSVLGPWSQDGDPLWDEDGGHGMLFRALDGQLHLALHAPNTTPLERAVFVPIDEVGGRLVRRDAPRA